MDFKLITTFDQLLSIEEQYDSLLKNNSEWQVFYEFSWLKNYILHFPDKSVDKNKLSCVCGYLKNELVLFAPFCMRGKKLTFICSVAADYCTILVDKKMNIYHAVKDLFSFVDEVLKPKKIILNNFRMSDTLMCAYTCLDQKEINHKQKAYKSFMSIVNIAPYTVFDSDKERWVKKQIKDIERREKNLEKESQISYSESNELTVEDLEFITKLKDEQFGLTMFHNKNCWDFFINLNRDLPNSFSVSKMFVDGELASLHFGFKDKQKICYYTPVYRSEKEFGSTGTILLKKIIDNARNEGLVMFDSLVGNENYKFNFCDRIKSCYVLAAFPFKNAKFHIFICKAVRWIQHNCLYN